MVVTDDARRLGGVTGADLGASPEFRRLGRAPSMAAFIAGKEAVLLVCRSPRDSIARRRRVPSSESKDARQRLLEPDAGGVSCIG
eukprot:CAMPEP_0172788684 /NCGR_PEP_ID=MMETSP1074-20121228/207080_1 /TAXON_ID=2916 /ORGANISM="Ceratium fusus, Strain PA161109" /LENGTH=84 /DNA_ID=CAMNT_0013625715 /DNA_START=1075 /DNA_END=1329 /DNA_ORIENTATION=-